MDFRTLITVSDHLIEAASVKLLVNGQRHVFAEKSLEQTNFYRKTIFTTETMDEYIYI